ncbi:hypothetical protein [Alteromonas sp. ASW11-130]|uniref:hypothetical protein n=1 Tax=Alteromonas sp. ASW11-130 TaxID=3015775 RepID=UPI0022420FCD|nr:hypothetical protein [Alteromonas sp. ASW11-130]MCW8091210.1 hypothetical protein [Alteromonas sp. ASW11-130]
MLLDSKSTSSSTSVAEERLSNIPTMVSEISRKISDFMRRYRALVENAQAFFEIYQEEYQTLSALKDRIKKLQDQTDRIDKYRKDTGRYPTIKGQPSAQRYLARIVAKQSKLEDECRELENKINSARNNRYECLDHLTDEILDLLDGHQIFSQFLGTIALSTPSPEDKVRYIRNEKYKPIYIAALAIALFDEVKFKKSFKSTFLKQRLEHIFPPQSKMSLMASKGDTKVSLDIFRKPMEAETKLAYREKILKPLAKVALLQSIGMHSPQTKALLGDDSYRLLEQTERKQLTTLIDKKTKDYIKLGIGVPIVRYLSPEEKEKFEKEEKSQLNFMLDVLTSLKENNGELGDLLRIPMTYASFVLSTKKEYDYRDIYRVYGILEEGMYRKTYDPDYVQCFLKMVGRFPLGAGIYFVSEDSGEIERAIVSSLYPQHVDEPICKQITRRQIQFLSRKELIISKQSNFFFEVSREESHYEKDYLDARYNNEFTWNAAELWEFQIPAIEFWKRDGIRKRNARFNPESYNAVASDSTRSG